MDKHKKVFNKVLNQLVRNVCMSLEYNDGSTSYNHWFWWENDNEHDIKCDYCKDLYASYIHFKSQTVFCGQCQLPGQDDNVRLLWI